MRSHELLACSGLFVVVVVTCACYHVIQTVVKSNRQPLDKWVRTEWSAERCKEHVLRGLKPESNLKALVVTALDDAALDGKSIVRLDNKALESILKEGGITKQVHRVRVMAAVQEIREAIQGYNADANEGEDACILA